MPDTTFPLEALGLSREEAIERVVGKLADGLLYGESTDEDGYTHRIRGEFARDLDKAITAKIDATVQALADAEVGPRIAALIEGVTLQQTNKWGEKQGSPVTFTEYLVQRAEAYMVEEVSYEGKTKGQDSFGWRSFGTRAAYMIDKHLSFAIKTAMEKALADANASITKGLNEAVRIAISNLTVQVKTEVKSR